MIKDVKIVPLKKIPDERGTVMHMLKSTDPHFIQFGEIYFSTIYPGVIKGWHVHTKMVVNNAVVSGRAKLVLYDMREDSPTKGELMEIFLGDDNYVLVQIPPGVANGFKAVGNERTILANCATIPHDPTEIKRIDPFDKSIPYNWDVKHG
ncbi:MAG: dTDP-4-dehydrorhamnose 3,5-epimerase family protein [Candidatus Aenigmarchaeota archaeon]|nr:dTDP-4-dehydrorhamnose 3,5-epimerase family protein [Candidatus Aenigmarchaeota archaeon]